MESGRGTQGSPPVLPTPTAGRLGQAGRPPEAQSGQRLTAPNLGLLSPQLSEPLNAPPPPALHRLGLLLQLCQPWGGDKSQAPWPTKPKT